MEKNHIQVKLCNFPLECIVMHMMGRFRIDFCNFHEFHKEFINSLFTPKRTCHRCPLYTTFLWKCYDVSKIDMWNFYYYYFLGHQVHPFSPQIALLHLGINWQSIRQRWGYMLMLKTMRSVCTSKTGYHLNLIEQHNEHKAHV